MTYINEIENLKDNLISSSAKSIFSNAHPKKSIDKIDVLELCKLNPLCLISPTQILEAFLSNTAFKTSYNISYNPDDKNKSKRKLTHLYRKNEDFIQEINHDSFAIGYPLVCMTDTKRKRLRYIPIFIWDLKLAYAAERLDQYRIEKNKFPKVAINPILIEAIQDEIDEEFSDPSLIYSENIQHNYIHILNKIALVLNAPFIGPDFASKGVFSFDTNPLKYAADFVPKLLNNGVIGLYNNSKSPIINDYKSILNSFDVEGLDIFTPKKKPAIDKESTVFSGVKLDHSQQKVIRSMQLNRDIVIHGPPGTGKSKTLTGTILYALSQGKTCLVICEKKTAIDVIYNNLAELGFAEFCIGIDDVKTDRRLVVNKAREILSLQDENNFNLFDSKSKKNITSRDRQQVQNKVQHINSIISEIKSKKEKLYKPLLKTDLTYSDLVLSNKSIRLDDFDNNFSLNDFKFESEEYKTINTLFEDLKSFLSKNPNPFNSIYEHLNYVVLESNTHASYDQLISDLHDTYYKDLLDLQKLLDIEISKTNALTIKYSSFMPDDGSILAQIIQKFKYFKKEVENTSIFNVGFIKSLNTQDFVKQLDLLLKTINSTYSQRRNFNYLIEFHGFYKVKSATHKIIIKRFCKDSKYEAYFNQWYHKVILERNHVDNFNFNGVQKGYYDIINDIDLINDFLIDQTYFDLNQMRSRAISKFKNAHKSLPIERFFSKKSSAKNKKLTLREISSHPSKIFNSFFPLVLTNPSSCSTLFPLEKDYFDVVVFDESSQIKVEDTFPALIRGKQRIVAGDLNQLPPMNYFKKRRMSAAIQNAVVSTNSLLDFCINNGFSEHYLDIHYRSKNPALITFSNHAFYNSRLIPLPSSSNEKPIEYYEVDGLFEKGVNIREAEEIVNYLEKTIDSKLSIGIATFNMFQREEILDQIQLKCAKDALFLAKMKQMEANGFFVKNLENIQGEERDVIIISTTYGINPSGTFRQSFGPVNSFNKGFKLLNVIITRAKSKMIVFCSIPNSYIEAGVELLSELKQNRGKAVLYGFLAYVKSVSLNNVLDKQKIINILQKNSNTYIDSSKIGYKNVLGKFSNSLLSVLNASSKTQYSVENNFALGGFIYELFLHDNSGHKILIDVNGKLLHGDYEDYLFDINRSNLATHSGYSYYRLWTSNLQNNYEQELYKFAHFMKDI